jgi:hypothetical protein
MLFRKNPANYIRKVRRHYNNVMLRRKKRLLYFLENNTPIEIIVREIELVRQPFKVYLWNRIKADLEMWFRKTFLTKVLYRMI